MMMIDGRYCRGVARAYHAAFLQVDRHINVEFIISYFERFGFLSVSTPEEKAEWIMAFTTNILVGPAGVSPVSVLSVTFLEPSFFD